MKNWKKFLNRRVMPALMLIALAAFAPLAARAQNSAGGSKSSDTGAGNSPKSQVQGPKSEVGPKSQVQSPKSEDRSAGILPAVAGASCPRTDEDCQALINSCAAVVEDLAKTRVLVEALERENSLLKERLETEKRTSGVLLELNETRKAEAVSLRETVAAKNETIVAKDGVIAAQDKLIETLKKKKTSPLKRLGDVLIGAGLMALFR